ncbi:hypothetical protein RC62_2424 [Flavobacterium aquidurense]|uniref:Uncharacterized protein n=1 Tax=Flavobacterium aquidurense TaxID=362413 RepID=A0A0Q0RY31_9FLAO|nr:hypothetical protein RC62_2424 [Flavobacterium aquidurense]
MVTIFFAFYLLGLIKKTLKVAESQSFLFHADLADYSRYNLKICYCNYLRESA